MTESQNHPSGVLRREFLQVGFSAYLGLSMTGILAARAGGACDATADVTVRRAPGRDHGPGR